MATSARNDPSAILQALVSALGLLLSVAAAGVLGLAGLAGIFGESLPLAESIGVFNLAWIALLTAVLAAPSLAYSVLRLMNRPAAWPVGLLGYRLAWALLLLWPLALALGSAASQQENLAWLILPPINLLVIGIPIWWVIEIARRRLPSDGPKQGWGALNFSIFISTPVIMAVEVMGFAFVMVLVVLAISSDPAWAAEIQRFAVRLEALQNNPENLLVLVRPLLQNPLVIYVILAVLSGMAPLIEELLKPLALWAMVGRDLSPAQGFAMGAVCGGAFALIESLLNLSGAPVEGWASLAVARSGTAVLHIATSALVGWSLAAAWKHGAYLRLGIAYLTAVALHGLWNGLSVLTLYNGMVEPGPSTPQWITSLAPVAPLGLGILALLLLLLLWGGNRILRRETAD